MTKAARRHYEENYGEKNDEPVVRGSGNVFADIGIDEPEEALAKARIVETIADLIVGREISQQEAGKLV